MMNQMQIIQMIKNGKNPQQVLMNIMKSNQNPMMQNVMQMAQNGDFKGIESMARNMCKEKGIDADSAFKQFQGMLK